jgi:hypothetical protein
MAEAIGDAKKYTAHTYLSTKIDLSKLHKTFGEKAVVEHFMRKAIQKSYKSISKSNCTINEPGENAVNLQ